MKNMILSLSAVAILGTPIAAQAIPFFFAGPGALDVDTDPATDVSLLVDSALTITDLNVSVHITGGDEDGFGHMEDFDLFLTSPGGTIVQFLFQLSDFGHVDAPLIATFDDEGTASALDLASNPSAGLSVIPFSALSAFDGTSLDGTWTLSILDDFIPNEGDVLVSWSISGEAVAVPAPATLLLLGFGLASLGLVRRRRSH